MAKRNPLTFDDKGLAENLQKSTAKGIDAFFSPVPVTSPPAGPEAKSEPEEEKNIRRSSPRKSHKIKPNDAEIKYTKASNRDTTTPRYHDTTVARYHDTIIGLVRKAVKEFGKEAATHRFTMEEKQAVADLIYTYKSQGIRTSENEIARIAINFIVEDFKENGKNSVLDKAIRALND